MGQKRSKVPDSFVNWKTLGVAMTTFDHIVMIVGFALIVIGLILFIMRKKESSNSDHVEGFGIKLNVRNPSIILIILGSGLLLVPRLLPQNPAPTEPQKPK